MTTTDQELSNLASSKSKPELRHHFTQNVGVAKALYDNEAEWADELAFQKDEILRVLDEQPYLNGSDSTAGWWYCVNKNGQRGLVPSNRLRMMHRFDNTNNRRVITPHRFGDLFMYDDADKMSSFGGFDDSFVSHGTSTTSPFMRDRLPPLSFDSGSIFDRIFPLSPVERFNNTPLRKMSNGDMNGAPGVVRNIPIKVEGTGNMVRSKTPQTSDMMGYSSGTMRLSRQASAPPPSFDSFRLPKRDSDRGVTEIPITINDGSNANRPKIAPKPKFVSSFNGDDTRFQQQQQQQQKPQNFSQTSKDEVDSDYDKPRKDIDDMAEVNWRLGKLGKPSRSTNVVPSKTSPMGLSGLNLSLPSKTNNLNLYSDNATFTSSIPTNDSDIIPSMNINTINNDDSIASPSPSSSGIVADINDSNLETNQRTSATSSLSAGSSSDHSSDHNDYDRPRGIDVGSILQPSATSRNTLSNRLIQPEIASLKSGHPLNHVKPGSVDSHRTEAGSTSVLQNVFEGLGVSAAVDQNRATPQHDNEPLFSRSLNLDTHQKTSDSTFNRSPSITPENMYAQRDIINDDRLKRGSNTPLEVMASQRASVSSASSCSDDDASFRKRAVCAKLSENYRLIEMSAKKMAECTAPRAWRQPHVLQQHLNDIKEAVVTITASLDDFLNATGRIAVVASSPKSDDLQHLLTPLRNSHSMIKQLKQNIDYTGWTLAALSRPKSNMVSTTNGNDALDQFVAIIKQLPIDCHKLVQWALTVAPSNAVRFLTTSQRDMPDSLNDLSGYLSYGADFRGLSAIDTSDECNRNSTSSSLSTATISSASNDNQYISSLSSNQTLKQSFNNNNNNNISNANNKSNHMNYNDKQQVSSLMNRNPSVTRSISSMTPESRVMEEDDLESVISDRESLYQDYALAGDDTTATTTTPTTNTLSRKRPSTNVPPISQLNSEVVKRLSEEDRHLLRFYSPQLDTHTDILSKAIEEFLTVVEEQLPPREFVQKGKLIILAAHKLIYIGDSIAQCVTEPTLSAEVKRTADRLCCVLKNCVQATKIAADQYPSVFAVQSMVDSIVTVSHAAHDLKLLVKQCC